MWYNHFVRGVATMIRAIISESFRPTGAQRTVWRMRCYISQQLLYSRRNCNVIGAYIHFVDSKSLDKFPLFATQT